MEFVRQREEADCGLAVAAMVSGRTYLEAREAALRLKAWSAKVGMTTGGMASTLIELGVPFPESRLTRLPERNPRNAPPGCVLKVPGTGRIGHWMAWDGDRVFDPLAPKPLAPGAWFRARRGWKRPSSFLRVHPV